MNEDVAPWREEFIAALRLLARASDAMASRGLGRPVLVGGGAVEFYSGGALMTGDIDVTTPSQPELEEELRRLGFVKPSGAGASLRGLDPARLRLVQPLGETARFRIVAVEDIIADRMGQFASGTAPEMGGQAALLLRLYPDLDRTYLERRIREETLGEQGIEDVEAAD